MRFHQIELLMTRKATAADVARDAGVSAATVDRVLNNRGGVGEDKERRVLEAARRLKLDRALDLRAARTLRVAVFLQPGTNPFHASLAAAFRAQNHGPNPFNLQSRIHHADPRDATSTLKALRKASASHEALITCLPDTPSIAAFLEARAASGQPVITLASDVGAPHAIYIGPDNYRAGRIAGELTGRFLGRHGGKVLVMAGHLSMIGQTERCEGIRDALAEHYPRARLLDIVEMGDGVERAAHFLHTALRAEPDIAAIYCASAAVKEIAQALALHSRGAARPVVIAHELTPERRRLLAEGIIDALIDQEPAVEVETALRQIAIIFGRSEPGGLEMETPLRIYLREHL
ncbi:LacI family DNA-binding transcriptional regulator [Thioclava sp. GXIMD2076]|uniref:LacI family DNA-binding transcriptional regulator n=1 Tax=Thioclava sp. GXIMD2076 TaxID=3131931 RepID=UPI0030D352AB